MWTVAFCLSALVPLLIMCPSYFCAPVPLLRLCLLCNNVMHSSNDGLGIIPLSNSQNVKAIIAACRGFNTISSCSPHCHPAVLVCLLPSGAQYCSLQLTHRRPACKQSVLLFLSPHSVHLLCMCVSSQVEAIIAACSLQAEDLNTISAHLPPHLPGLQVGAHQLGTFRKQNQGWSCPVVPGHQTAIH